MISLLISTVMFIALFLFFSRRWPLVSIIFFGALLIGLVSTDFPIVFLIGLECFAIWFVWSKYKTQTIGRFISAYFILYFRDIIVHFPFNSLWSLYVTWQNLKDNQTNTNSEQHDDHHYEKSTGSNQREQKSQSQQNEQNNYSSYDPYKVLGITKSATDQEIKKAYRQLVKRYHPDINHNADAPDKFKQVQAAMENIRLLRGF